MKLRKERWRHYVAIAFDIVCCILNTVNALITKSDTILFFAMLAAICFGAAGVLNIMTEVNYGKQVQA